MQIAAIVIQMMPLMVAGVFGMKEATMSATTIPQSAIVEK